MQPLHSTQISMCIHPGIFSFQGPSGKGPGYPGMLCPVPLHSCLPQPDQPSTSTPGAPHKIPHGKLLAPSAMVPMSPLQWDTLQKCPGDPPGCVGLGVLPRGNTGHGPICDPGFLQEAPAPRGSCCAAPGGTQRAKTDTRIKCDSLQGLQNWSWPSAVPPLSQFLPGLYFLIPKLQNEQRSSEGLRHLNTSQMCCFINPAEGLEAAGRD